MFDIITDFVELESVPFTIPAMATTATIDVTVCGETQVEADERIVVTLTDVVGAQCLEGTCDAVGTIHNDDGPPSISINNITIFEGLGSGTRPGTFTVSLSHPSPTNTLVNFATRNGTAAGASACGPFLSGFRPDYLSRSGTLTIPANTLSAPITINICNDGLGEADQTLFVDLSSPSPAGVTITDAVGRATIREPGFVGEFAVVPDEADVRAGQVVAFMVGWTVPEGEVWRDLRTIDVRIRGGKTALWVRWDEVSNTFSLCGKSKGDDGDGDDDGDERRAGVQCGPGATPGADVVLETSLARLHVADSAVVGSGPTGSSVTLDLAISFKAKAGHHRYNIELAATDDLGHRDDFRRAGTVEVERAIAVR